jgi:hypothetical protein
MGVGDAGRSRRGELRARGGRSIGTRCAAP